MRSTLLLAALLAGGATPVLGQQSAPPAALVQPAEDSANPQARRRWNAAQEEEHQARRRWNAAQEDQHHARRRWNAANPPVPEVRPHRPEPMRPTGGAQPGGRGR